MSPTVDPLPRVLVVDADARTRESLSGLLGIGRRVAVVGSAGDPGGALRLAGEVDPDVVILDPRLPDLERGRMFIGELREALPTCRIVVMNGAATVPEGWSPIDADAYVRKTFRAHDLLDAVLLAGRPPAVP
jgi:DNA-binding NarL/FixJ family response regulator